MWVKVDDALPDHPKVLEAGLHLGASGPGRVLAIWLKGMCYCNHNLTDGFIPERVLRSWKLYDRRPLDVAYVMVQSGIFVQEDRGFRFHDYTDYQPTRSDVTAKRKKDLERKKKKLFPEESNGSPTGFQMESKVVPSTPARPGPSIGTHREDHRLAAAGFPQAAENRKVLRALIWRETHAAYLNQPDSFTYVDVLERTKRVAAAAQLAYGGDWFCQQVETAMARVAQQRRRSAA